MAIKNAGSDSVNLLDDVTVQRDIKLNDFTDAIIAMKRTELTNKEGRE